MMWDMVANNANPGIQFIDGAIGFNADMRFGNAGTTDKRSLARITRFGINFKWHVDKSKGEVLMSIIFLSNGDIVSDITIYLPI